MISVKQHRISHRYASCEIKTRIQAHKERATGCRAHDARVANIQSSTFDSGDRKGTRLSSEFQGSFYLQSVVSAQIPGLPYLAAQVVSRWGCGAGMRSNDSLRVRALRKKL